MKPKRARSASGSVAAVPPVERRAAAGWRERGGGSRSLSIAGLVLLVVLGIWWTVGLVQPVPHLPPGRPDVDGKRFTNILIMPFAGLDFHHNYVGVRAWLKGENLYAAMPGDPANVRYTYPPTTLVAFAWTALFSPSLELNFNAAGVAFPFSPSFPATFCWMAFVFVVIGFAAWRSHGVRGLLGLPPFPLIFIFGVIFASYPVLFELERGNCNALPLLAIMLLLAVLRWSRGWAGDGLAGLCVASAIGVKPYAVVLLLGLVALRRPRAIGWALGWLVLWAMVLWRDVGRWLEVARSTTEIQLGGYFDFSHSLIAHWALLTRDLPLGPIASLRPTAVVALFILAVALPVAWTVFRAERRADIAWPFLLWLAALATFVSPVAQDYNLLFVPLAVVCLWSSRDPWWCSALLLPTLVWWQPLYLGFGGWPILLLKAVSVPLVGVLIMYRVKMADSSRMKGGLPAAAAS